MRTLVHQAEPGSPAPSERELVQKFGVARMTVRHALDSLVSQGLLERIPGRGTFVAKPHVDMQARLSSFTEEMERRGRAAGARTLLRRRETAGPGVARALQVEEGHPIVHWQRLRTADGVPACVTDVYLSLDLFPDLLAEPEPDSLYVWFGEQSLMPTWGEDSVVADSASEIEASHLEVGPGDPVLRISRRAYCREQVCEVSRSVYRANQFTLWVPVLRAEFER
ncbi:GntR family transcriptional regulator [Nocardioides mangrovicus]|uniref:GntR family transcriptional regulator n=1 Tax=Nocardioides mangrovicus TaxID=2478913 RepID=A0A3L8P0C1_9ACTN|nr:GntR family transcriptional regulator [Nocardioides mangrovicus]